MGDSAAAEVEAAIGWVVIVDEGNADADATVCCVRTRAGCIAGAPQVQHADWRAEVGSIEGQALETVVQGAKGSVTNQSAFVSRSEVSSEARTNLVRRMTLGHVYDMDLRRNENLIKEVIIQAQGEVSDTLR